MREIIYKAYSNLKDNQYNKIIYFEDNQRKEKVFAQFAQDLDEMILKLEVINSSRSKRIGILGVTSYMWMLIDHACIKGGYHLVAIPETQTQEQISKILSDCKIDLLLVDFILKTKYQEIGVKHFYFNCTENEQLDIAKIESTPKKRENKNIILENYSTVFSSGTSERLKYINLKFYQDEPLFRGSLLVRLKTFIELRNSIWSVLRRKDNRIIIFLPFSHPMQRWFVRLAIIYKIDIVLSNPQNCIKHIITERPNIMVSVPPIYDALAELINVRIKKFRGFNLILFNIYNKLHINRLGRGCVVKKMFDKILFQKIKNLYGGRADIFVTGSSPTKIDTLKTFYNVGVKIFEAYSQSEWSQIIMNTPKNYKIGSVGRQINKGLKINDDSEILIKYNKQYDESNHSILNIDEDGYIHTGDLGYLDKDGYLFIIGRKDDVIVFDTGKKVHPAKIENKLTENNDIKHALIYTRDKLKLNAIINVEKGIDSKNISLWIEQVNRTLPNYEQINNFYIVDIPFTTENGFLTPTLKLKRKAIIEKFGQQIVEPVTL